MILGGDLTFDEHAAVARRAAKAAGLADCVHYATDWSRRADDLYAAANGSGVRWWSTAGTIGLLADGRMVITSEEAWFFEPALTFAQGEILADSCWFPVVAGSLRPGHEYAVTEEDVGFLVARGLLKKSAAGRGYCATDAGVARAERSR